MKPLNRLDREAVKVVYFRADSTDTLGPIEVSWDDGVTWAALEAARVLMPDPSAPSQMIEVDAGKLTVAGPVSGSTAGKVLTMGRNRGIVRIVDNPEVEIHRFTVDVI